jgi:elongation factor G
VKNTAVQPLLDGVCAYLASPSERQVVAHDTAQPAGSPQVELVLASAAPLVALTFKLEEGRFGQLTYMWVYQRCLKKGQFIFHGRSGKRIKVPKLVLMHSNEMEVRPCECGTVLVLMTLLVLKDIDEIGPGEFGAIVGVECVSDDTAPQSIQWYVEYPILISILEPESSADLDVCPRPCHFTSHQACWK